MASEVSPTTPSPATQREVDLSLSPAAQAAVAAGQAASTTAAYAEDWEEFRKWCAMVGRTALPCSGETLAEYATHLAYRADKPLSPASIGRARSAIRTAHRTGGFDAPDSKGLADVVKGYRAALSEARDPRAKPRKATAASVPTLLRILGKVDRSTPSGCRDAALMLVGFGAATRRSEASFLNIEDVAIVDEGLLLSVYRRKTRRHEEVAIPYAAEPELCPVLAVREWLEFLAAHRRTEGALFVRINQHGHLAPPMTRKGVPIGDPFGRLTPEAVSDVIERRARAAGLAGRWRGHSVRRGYATEARRAGHDRIRIARGGGWTEDSPVLAGYIEDADRWTDNALKGVL